MTEYKCISVTRVREKLFTDLMDKDTTGVGFSAMLAEAARVYCSSEATDLHTPPEVTKEYLHSLSPEEFKKHQVLVQSEAVKRLD